MNAIGSAILVFVFSMFFMGVIDEWLESSDFGKLFYSVLIAIATLLIMWK